MDTSFSGACKPRGKKLGYLRLFHHSIEKKKKIEMIVSKLLGMYWSKRRVYGGIKEKK